MISGFMLCVLEAISARVDLWENDGGLGRSDSEDSNGAENDWKTVSCFGNLSAGLENCELSLLAKWCSVASAKSRRLTFHRPSLNSRHFKVNRALSIPPNYRPRRRTNV